MRSRPVAQHQSAECSIASCVVLGVDPGIILSVLVAQLVGRLGGDGFWEKDYGWGVRVCRHFGARRMSSVRHGTRLGDLEENWFLLFSN